MSSQSWPGIEYKDRHHQGPWGHTWFKAASHGSFTACMCVTLLELLAQPTRMISHLGNELQKAEMPGGQVRFPGLGLSLPLGCKLAV